MNLKKLFFDKPISSKLVIINLIVVITALFVTGSSIIFQQSQNLKKMILGELETNATMISYNLAAAVAFGDELEAERVLGSLSAASSIKEAIVWDEQQKIFAYYTRDKAALSASESLPDLANHDEGVSTTEDYIFLNRPIHLDNQKLGTITLIADFSKLISSREDTISIVFIALLLALMLSCLFIFSLQKIISSPIHHLSEVMRFVSKNKCYTIRAQKHANDELGELIDGFNHMLAITQDHHKQLTEHKANLEEIVKQRTFELEQSNLDLHETINELKESKKSLILSEAKKQAAEESAKAKSRFLANMSHELRTPMNGVLGMLNLLSETTLSIDQTEYTTIALESASLLLNTLNEILDLTKIEAGKIQLETIEIELFSLIDDVFSVLGESAFKKGVELAWIHEQTVPATIIGDPYRIKQVLYNTVNNAIKFTDHGSVFMRVSLLEQLNDQTVLLKFTITDTGIGIPKEAQNKIFDRFTQADESTTRQFGGTGLGLAICQELLSLMDGQISVESEPGKGSTFSLELKVKLPLTLQSNQQNSNFEFLKQSEMAIQSSQLVFYILDDQKVGQSVLQHHLSNWQLQCHTASELETFIEMIQSADHNSILLVDIGIPQREPNAIVEQIFLENKKIGARIITIGSLSDQKKLSKTNRNVLASQWIKPLKYDTLKNNLHLFLSKDHQHFHECDTKDACLTTTELASVDSKDFRLLLVEDNVVNQKVAIARLKQLGFNTDSASNGAEALERIDQHEYDLILMDCQMPVLDGFETSRRIRESNSRYANVPIIALTANALPGDREKCLAAGMCDYITKPLQSEVLTEKLRYWLGPK